MRALLVLLLAASVNLQARDLELKTKIQEVTVFQSGAQVSRTGSINIPAGEHEVKITDATPLLKKESIQVKGEGNFTILSVNYQVVLEERKMDKLKIDALDARKKDLMRKLEEVSVKIKVLHAEEVTISNLRNINTATKGVTVDQIAKAQELVRLKLPVIKQQLLDADRQILDMYDEYQSLSQHLLSLKTPGQQVSYEIVIKVSAKTECKGDFAISYIVPNARWSPAYDLRVKSIADPMEIDYKANVSQESGEDWNNVRLKLSTGDPSRGSEKPVISAWWLYLNRNYESPLAHRNYYSSGGKQYTRIQGTVINEETGMGIPWCLISVPGTEVKTSCDSSGMFSILLPLNTTALNVFAVGYQNARIVLDGASLTVKMTKKNLAMGATIKTDYDKSLATLDPALLDGEETALTDKVLESVNNGMYGLVDAATKTGGTITAAEYQATISEAVANKSINSVVMTSAGVRADNFTVTVNKKLNIVDVEFVIEEKYSIPSGPSSISVQIQTIGAPVSYQYYCAPRIDKDVFLTAKLTNWEQYNLLKGEANVYYEGTFVGNTQMNTQYLVDTLEISLGRDKSVRVERKKIMDYHKKQSLGSENVASNGWDITLRNSKSVGIDILVQDQFPVSADSKITVVQEERSGGKLDENTGLVSWDLKLEPSATKVLQLKYKVKYPKSNTVGLD